MGCRPVVRASTAKSFLLKLLGLVLLTASALPSSVLAVPFELSYMGRLVEESGRPVDGPVELEVNFYNSETLAEKGPAGRAAVGFPKIA